MSEDPGDGDPEARLEKEGFGELLKYTIVGYVLGLATGVAFDSTGQSRSAVGQWMVRTLAGEGESLFEGFYALRKRLAGHRMSMSQAYGWGKLAGLLVPWVVDWVSRRAGIDMYGVEGFHIPFLYAMSDQIGASISGLVFLRRRTGSMSEAVSHYRRHPVLLASAAVVLIVPLGVFGARLMGFSPTTQVLTALETILANLCWVPPLIGWLTERGRHAGRGA